MLYAVCNLETGSPTCRGVCNSSFNAMANDNIINKKMLKTKKKSLIASTQDHFFTSKISKIFKKWLYTFYKWPTLLQNFPPLSLVGGSGNQLWMFPLKSCFKLKKCYRFSKVVVVCWNLTYSTAQLCSTHQRWSENDFNY